MSRHLPPALMRRSALLRLAALAVAWFTISLLLVGTGVVHAGPGHDHGPAASSAASAPSPRAVANSEHYQFVGIVEGEVLVIYLDRFADNVPVTSAALEVTIGDQQLKTELQRNGTYEAASKLLKQPGEHALLVSIVDGQTTDLLVGALTIPKPAAAGASSSFDHSVWSHIGLSVGPLKAVGLGVGALLLAVAAAGFFKLPRLGTAGIAVVGAMIVVASTAFAHEGHDHGPEGAANGNAPQRLPDGTVFLPKPTQRLLEVRTRILQPETGRRSVRFQGRIIADPNRSGVVQSTIQGRYSAPASGVPVIGTRVKAGDLMGQIAPSFASKESSDVAQTLGELDQQIALARSKLRRQEQLLQTNVVARATVDETRIQLDGYVKRRAELLDSKVQPEELRAPVDGVVVAARVVPGQVVAQADQLFQIVDPARFMVEALVFEQGGSDEIVDAVATFGEGKSSKLQFIGRSRSLQQQYSVIKFAVVEPHADLNVGTPVIVVGATGQPVTGLRLPRAAIAQAPNGQMVVFVHKEAEIFEPRAVRFQPFDAETVLIGAGVEKGDKVVVQNAPLVNQVR